MNDYHKYSDALLSAMLKTGDHAAFNEIHNRYYPLLYNHAYKRLPHREEVRDLLQELFATLWNNRNELEFSTGIGPYLYIATRNRIINLFNKEKVRDTYARSLQQYLEEGENVTDFRLREKELIALVEKEIANLPPQTRKVFELSRYQQLSHEEIAELMHTSPLTVRKQIQNALKILRSRLGTTIFSLFF